MLDDLCTAFFAAIKDRRVETTIPVIALEGQSYAGKSTALATLRQEGYGAIREYSEYKTTPASDHFVPLARDAAQEDFLFYLAIERQRYQECLEARCQQRAVFVDRSILTLIAYRCAILHLSVSAGLETVAWAMEQVVSGVFPILYPQHVIYLHTPLQVLKQRHQIAGDHLPSYFMDKQFYTAFLTFFQAWQREAPAQITMIDGTGKEEGTLQQIHQVMQQFSKT